MIKKILELVTQAPYNMAQMNSEKQKHELQQTSALVFCLPQRNLIKYTNYFKGGNFQMKI